MITGGGGQLATDLRQALGRDTWVFTHAELDIRDTDALDFAIGEVDPDVVFNCAAFHNLDECETKPRRAWEVNVDAVRELAVRSPYLIQISTNYVFDGRRTAPYAETDVPSPRSVYAITKLAGEYAAAAYAPKSLIVRTGALYGERGSASKGGNFVERVVARARTEGELTMVVDQRVQPTFTADLAAAIAVAAEFGADGIAHLTASGACSWYEFAVAIIKRAGIDAPVRPVATSEVPGGVERPLNGVLTRPRADALGLPTLRQWDAALDAYMRVERRPVRT